MSGLLFLILLKTAKPANVGAPSKATMIKIDNNIMIVFVIELKVRFIKPLFFFLFHSYFYSPSERSTQEYILFPCLSNLNTKAAAPSIRCR